MQQKRTGKRGWGDDAKHNLKSVVKALLLLADEKLELDDPEFKTALQVEWYSEKKLRVTGEIKKKTPRGEKTIEVGTTKKDLAHLVKKAGEKLELPKPKQELKSSGEEREASAVQNVLDCLKVMGLLEDERPNNRTNTRYWKFSLTLKTQFSIEENLRCCEQKWNEHKQQNSSSQITFKSATEDDINWSEVCGKVLAQQQEKQLFRRSITGRGVGHEAKNVYVKLGLIKPKEKPQRGEDFQPAAAKGMRQYGLTEKEIELEYKYDEFLEQVIEGKEKNFAIVGEPGAGKSTWLEQIALYVNKSEKCFPICVSLASLGGKTLEEYLFQIWLKNALIISHSDLEITSAHKKLEELFKSGKVWLLLDGVDEMRANESPLQTITNQLRGWVDLARVVLTCRANVWEANPNALPNFETYQTLHFDDEQVDDFIGQWFTREGKPELGKKLQNKLGESGHDRLQDLIKNPLRLAMLCGIWYFNQGNLPHTKATLYQGYIDYFYQWKPHPQLTEDLDKQEELHTALSKLALEAIDKKLPLRKKFVHKIIGQSLFQLARDVGWLNWVYKDSETGEDVYAFFHLTFQEYFAACGIKDWDYFLPREHKDKPVEDKDYPGKYKPYRIFEPQWKEVFLLWLGRDKTEVPDDKKEAFIQRLIPFNDGCGDFYKYRAYFLVAAGIAEFKNCRIADQIVTQMVEWLIAVPRYGCFGEEIRAAIQETDSRRVIDKLILLLYNSRYKTKRHDIIGCIGNIGFNDSQAIDALNKIIDGQNQNKYSIEIAAYCLGKSSDLNLKKKAIKILTNILNSQRYNKTSAFYLGEIGFEDPDVIEALAKQLRLTNPNNSISQMDLLMIASALLKITPSQNVIYHEANNILKETENPVYHLKTHEETITIDHLHALGLKKVNAENIHLEVIKSLNHMLLRSSDSRTQDQIYWCLERIVFGKHFLPENHLIEVIIGFKDCTKEQIRQYSKILWHCAQNLPYPDFYQAWHQTSI